MIEVEVGGARIVLTPIENKNGFATEQSYSYGDLLMAIRRAIAAMEPGDGSGSGKHVRINNLLDDLKAVTG